MRRPWGSPNVLDDTLHHRLPPGAGELSITALLATLRSHGVRCPVSVEVLADDIAAMAPLDAARLLYRASVEVLTAAGWW